jgi:hypothetical protein
MTDGNKDQSSSKIAHKYSGIESLAGRVELAKETGIEQRVSFLQKHAPCHLRGDENLSSLIKDLIKEECGIPVTIAACDIIGSTMLMKNSKEVGKFAGVLTSFIDESRAHMDNCSAWFDSFTGDGFVCYWLPKEIAEIEDVEEIGELERSVEVKQEPYLSNDVLGLVRKTLRLYGQKIHPSFCKNLQHIPVLTGLSMGVDSGKGVFVPTPTSDRITLVGEPFVGAVRLEANVPPFAAGFGPSIGRVLWRIRDDLCREYDLNMTKGVIETQEFKSGEQIYILNDMDLDEELINDGDFFMYRAREEFLDQNPLTITSDTAGLLE